jgi:hypothetical protein
MGAFCWRCMGQARCATSVSFQLGARRGAPAKGAGGAQNKRKHSIFFIRLTNRSPKKSRTLTTEAAGIELSRPPRRERTPCYNQQQVRNMRNPQSRLRNMLLRVRNIDAVSAHIDLVGCATCG